MKIRPVRAELFLLGRRTDRHYEANNRFSQFCVAPNIKLHEKFIFCFWISIPYRLTGGRSLLGGTYYIASIIRVHANGYVLL